MLIKRHHKESKKATELGKIIATHVTNKGLIFSIYKN